jgi:hypothetical protein
MAQELAADCIYTIAHRDYLDEQAHRTPPEPFSERKAWTGGRQLWLQAKEAKQAMPVLLGDAAYANELLYWGLLTDVHVDGEGTTFTVDRLRRFKRTHTPQELERFAVGCSVGAV